MSKSQKSKKQVLFVSQMSSYSEKMRENEATGEDFYILEGNSRGLILGIFLGKLRFFARKYQILNGHQKSTVESYEVCDPILKPG